MERSRSNSPRARSRSAVPTPSPGSACRFRPAIASSASIGLESLEKNAFTEDDERLLNTLSTSLGVALENARLFDETKHLLAETNDRAAELALINEVQRGLAEKLDIQAMYDLVGDKIQEIFDAQVVDIGVFDEARIGRPLPVHDRTRRPLPDLPVPIAGGLTQAVLEARGPVLINSDHRRLDGRTAASPTSSKVRPRSQSWSRR